MRLAQSPLACRPTRYADSGHIGNSRVERKERGHRRVVGQRLPPFHAPGSQPPRPRHRHVGEGLQKVLPGTGGEGVEAGAEVVVAGVEEDKVRGVCWVQPSASGKESDACDAASGVTVSDI